MEEKNTELLQSELQHADNIEKFFADNSADIKERSVMDYLNQMIIKYGAEVSEVVRRSELSNYAYQIFDGRKKAGRDKLLQLAFGFPLTLEETNRLLKCGGHSELYVKTKRDAYIMYAIQKSYDIHKTNELLFQNGEKTFE